MVWVCKVRHVCERAAMPELGREKVMLSMSSCGNADIMDAISSVDCTITSKYLPSLYSSKNEDGRGIREAKTL